jgi:myo-inositol-1(or 4)-monophosphatase
MWAGEGFGLDGNKPYPEHRPMCCDQLVTAEQIDSFELGALAVRLARGAGELARAGRRAGYDIDTKSTETDVVTEVDRRVERWLHETITAVRPGDGVLGEEGADELGASRVRWVVDPIDGTVNFTLGLPLYAVSVAAEVDGEVVAGCVHNPESGETFRAVRGGGAYVARAGEAETRLSGPRGVPVERMVVGTGFGYRAQQRQAQAAVLPEVIARIGDIRRFGAASLDLCAVGAGQLDGYFELGLNRWDYAAGLLVALEAGCVASGLRGRPAGSVFTAVCAPEVADDFFALLADAGADRPG